MELAVELVVLKVAVVDDVLVVDMVLTVEAVELVVLAVDDVDVVV